MNSESKNIFFQPPHSPHFFSIFFCCWGWGKKGWGAAQIGCFSPNKNLFPTKDLCDACGQPRASRASPLAPAAKAAAPKGPKVGQAERFEGVGIFRDPPFLGWTKIPWKNIICILYTAKIVGCYIGRQIFLWKHPEMPLYFFWGTWVCFFLFFGKRGRFGVGQAKAQKRSEAWQLGTAWVGWLGGEGQVWGRWKWLGQKPWPWKRTYMENAWGKLLIHYIVCFFLKFQPVMLAFTIVFFLTPFVPRWALLGLKNISIY